jgi:hypothetical protein
MVTGDRQRPFELSVPVGAGEDMPTVGTEAFGMRSEPVGGPSVWTEPGARR